MALDLPVVVDDRCKRHQPIAEIWLGVRTTGTEVPERVDAIRAALRAAGAPEHDAAGHDDTVLHRVHAPELLEHLATIWDAWVAAGLPEDPGQDRVVPYVFPTSELLAGQPPRLPTAVHARAGRYCYDTMTLVGPGTWDAARAAVDVALTAVDLVLAGSPAAYGLCRPPGHHATAGGFGGSCYLNNAAAAAEALRAGGAATVAVIDIDAHHGNGTQALFYERADVFYGSVHVDPGAGWFPHYVGFAEETGRDGGAGRTLNRPLAPGAADEVWLAALEAVCDAASRVRPDAVVLSLGVDAAVADPESPLAVTAAGFRAAGALVAELGPCVAVQEGGYHLDTLGELVVATLSGLAGPRSAGKATV
jgi:acetoin utilization deacetylase AcuC-like enzyme